MADTIALKNRIRAAIKANDNQEITGPVLQQALLDMVDELSGTTETEASQRQNGDSTFQQSITAEKNRAEGVEQSLSQADTALNNLITGIKNNIDNGYVYAGIAMPSTTPVSGKVFYVAVQAGTYTNFGGTAVTEGITILKYNGASWVKEQALFTDGGVFDISAYRATGGTLATYADLTAALGTNGKNIPQSLRKGGMSVKFVQSSDNKYVQYRLMSDSFGTIESDWQNIGLAQQIGLSETVAMSQKAVTDELNKINSKTAIMEQWNNRIAALESDKLTSKVVIYASDVVEYIPNVSSNITIQLQNANGIISKDANYTHKHLYYNINSKGEVNVQDDNVNVEYKYDAPAQVNIEARGTATYKGVPITFPVVRKTIYAVLPSYIGYIEDYNNWNNTGTKLIKHNLNGQYNVTNPYDLAYLVVAIPKNGMVSSISSIIQKGTLDAVQQYNVIDKGNYTLYVCRTRHNKGTYTFAVS